MEKDFGAPKIYSYFVKREEKYCQVSDLNFLADVSKSHEYLTTGSCQSNTKCPS